MTNLTYNGTPIPDRVRTDRIISAFENDMDETRLEYWREQDISAFPPITGYPSVIDEKDSTYGFFMSGANITDDIIGQPCWRVTDGHHRTIVLLERKVRYTEVKMDPSCFTDERELKAYRESR